MQQPEWERRTGRNSPRRNKPYRRLTGRRRTWSRGCCTCPADDRVWRQEAGENGPRTARVRGLARGRAGGGTARAAAQTCIFFMVELIRLSVSPNPPPIISSARFWSRTSSPIAIVICRSARPRVRARWRLPRCCGPRPGPRRARVQDGAACTRGGSGGCRRQQQRQRRRRSRWWRAVCAAPHARF